MSKFYMTTTHLTKLEDSDTTESKKESKDDTIPQKQIQNGEIVNKYII